MSTILNDVSAPALIAAIEGNLAAFLAKWSDWSRVEVHDDPQWLWGVSDIEFPLFNFVARTNFPPAEADQRIEAALDRCKTRAVPLLWWTGPSTRPISLGGNLVAHGFDHVGELPGMALDLTAWKDTSNPVPGLAIEQVLDKAAAQIWNHTLVLGFQLPDVVEEALTDSLVSLELSPHAPLRHYLARLNGQPVGTITLFFGAGVGGIYNVTTLYHVRERGIGTAIVSAALRIAREEGYRAAILHSSDMGLRIYQRMGFKTYCALAQYVWSP